MEKQPALDTQKLEDIKEELAEKEPEVLKYFKLLPKPLWERNFTALQQISQKYSGEEKEALSERKINYILGIVEGREKAIVDFHISEPVLKEKVENSPEGKENFGKTLHELLVTSGNLLGSGTTARVKEMRLESGNSIAVKYLLTPTAKTLSAEGEYDMLREVEVITKVEEAEEKAGVGEYIRVPHPYFHYKRGKLQCYGMSKVEGVHLEELLINDDRYAPLRDKVLQTLHTRFASEETRNTVRKEADRFMRAVHEVCLHGDIKPKNFMLDTEGILYLIDFGQSVSMNSMSEGTREQFENIQQLERDQVQACISELFAMITPQENIPVSKVA